jgi:predicted amidohydrolase YtcJ
VREVEALGLAQKPELAQRITIETDAAGRATGWITADARSISELFDLLPKPPFAQQVAGTRAFFRALNSAGLTGVMDPGGYNLAIPDYQPLFQVWRDGALTLRVRFSLCAPRRDHELEDLQTLTQFLPMGFGDAWLRFNGIGENVTWGMYNNDRPSAAQKDQLHRIAAETPIADLRWSIAHLNDASPESLHRMKALGVGVHAEPLLALCPIRLR